MAADQERILELTNSTSGILLHVNYPRPPPPMANLSLRLIAPPGYVVLLRLYGLVFSDEEECHDGKGKIEVSFPFIEKVIQCTQYIIKYKQMRFFDSTHKRKNVKNRQT